MNNIQVRWRQVGVLVEPKVLPMCGFLFKVLDAGGVSQGEPPVLGRKEESVGVRGRGP